MNNWVVPYRALLAILATSALACHPQAMRPAAAMEEAARQAESGTPKARTLALAGFHAFLVQGNIPKAQSRFDAAVQADPSEPYGLIGQLLVAQRRAHPERALHAALSLCEKTPRHPLAVAGARFVSEVAGTASGFDDQIVTRGTKALAAGLSGDGAHLLRAALSTIYGQRGAENEESTVMSDIGVVQKVTLLGPFSAYHVLGFDELLAPEKNGSLEGPFNGPFGQIKPRVLSFPEGRLTLANEGPLGDVYLVSADVDVPEQAIYVVRTATFAIYKLYVDGTLLLTRRRFERTQPLTGAAGINLSPGRHRLLMKLSKNDRSAALALLVSRADGKPANLRFQPAEGRAGRWGGVNQVPVPLVFPSSADFARALEGEVGRTLATYLGAAEGMGRDRDGMKALLSHLPATLTGPALSSLRADLAFGDRTIPSRVAHGRASRELEADLERDPADVGALLSKAALALEDSQLMEASDALKKARTAYSPVGYPVPMFQAKVELALGLDAQADQSALEALSLQPGLCEALGLRYDIARRREAASLADSLIDPLSRCPGSQVRAAEHARMRGDVAAAAALYERLVARDPGSIPNVLALSSIYVSQKRFAAAIDLLETERAAWPRNVSLVKQMADIYEFWGKRAEALGAREQALLIDGGDLTLRRALERARTGKEPLAEYAIDGESAIAAYEKQRGTEDAAGAYVLDMAAIRAYPDGSMLDRIHVIQKALNQAGVSELAEVAIPSGAQILTLRTRKADGTSLEPESIEGKETISMPGVQVGDYVEYEFLEAHPSRGPAQPGFTAANFYFQIGRMPNNWSTYTVVAPKGMGMTVDAHNMKAPAPQVHGDLEVFTHEERHVPPFIPEPDSPPSPNEYLPFVSVAAGAAGLEGLVTAYADAYLERGQRTFEIEEFARTAARGKSGKQAVEAVYSSVMDHLSGRDAGLAQTASASLAQGRGSRLWLLKASLEALGIPARVAMVRTFATDPSSYRSPSDVLIAYVCLRAEPKGEAEIWLDPLVRFAPFGELPEQASGGREAWLLPEPGRPLRKVSTPSQPPRLGKEVTLNLKVAADGVLSGSGEESYRGFEAAQLGETLEALSPTQRDQALQGALSRYFGGAELSSIKADVKHQVGAPLVVRYSFTAPNFGRADGPNKLLLPSLTFAANLGRRYVQVGSRRTTLYVDSTEQSHTVAKVELPPGYSLSAPLGEVKANSPYGLFQRRERQEGSKILIEETYRLSMARIPVKNYDEFAQFAGEVDLIQARDLTIEKTSSPQPSPSGKGAGLLH